MSELTVFLEARLAEDEAVARASWPNARWWVDGPAAVSGKWWVYDAGAKFDREPDATHAARHDPARVLVEVEAKRAIVALHSPYEFPQVMTYGTIIACNECGSVDDSPQEWPCPTLRLLASVYRDHPGYQEGWAL